MAKKSLVDNYEEVYDIAVIPQLLDETETQFYVNLLQKEKNLRILDLGCAEGALSIALAKKGHDVTAVDVSDRCLLRARENAVSNGVKVLTLNCNIEKDVSPLQKNYFDVIFFLNVIEHLKNPVQALSNLRILMANDGVLYLNTPNVLTTVNFRAALIDSFNRQYDKPTVPGSFHFVTYDYRSLEQTLQFIGFSSRLITNKDPIHRLRLKNKGLFGRLRESFPRRFPLFDSDLLLECRKCEPIDAEKLMHTWAERK